MNRALPIAALVGVLLFAGCGSDEATDSSDAPSDVTVSAPADSDEPATDSTTATADEATTVATEAAPDTTAAAATTAAPTTATPTEPTTPNEARAASLLLTAAELPGWTIEPSDDDDEDDSDSDVAYDAPECAAMKSVQDDPALEDDAEVELVSPDGNTTISQNMTVGDPAGIQRAYDAFADPTTAGCFKVAMTAALQEPGAMPEGVTVSGVDFVQQPLVGGEQAVGYAGTVTVTGDDTGITAPFSLRFDAVRAGDSIALLFTFALPGGEPVDPAAIVTAVAARMTAA